ncbi:ankyrin repeat domain-containing protein [Aspergillus clavatus NRRL 1]|uniref:Uncharacterized protein n=1 Tax=Aspergillus clavatus (strain ATCC 1007 / CBS 513.65 / DSM 816 / NCTC 3887 / NRRL 1 / QM 1276 / 107) TaxID=344612 RepID=A1CCW5_ASPCL|nr:uncharacterized protein ACLA_063390 [Aspergillus clavatus NRRL 1]EAW12372.1 hypothetical protein ACLA_063390 [Aspergillus clavatus NRRL 1]
MFNLAVINNNLDMVSLLLHGMDPNVLAIDWEKRHPALGYVAMTGCRELVSLLLRHGANMKAEDWSGWRRLHAACFAGETGTTRLLIESGADVHA